jgi:EAL domain-containing protein (putative c-di-GMP-specific phosphodiesterase class I)
LSVAHEDEPKPCALCREDAPLEFEFTMAFQPIVDIRDRSVFAYESLVRGLDGTGAAAILARVNERNVYTFDQQCRVTAVELASKLGVDCFLSINFLPNAVYQASTCIRATLAAARRCNFPTDRLIFEITENERPDQAHLKSIVVAYRRQGFMTAFDDFGAGYSGLSLLAEFQPDIIKLDMALIRGIDQDKVRQAIVRGLIDMCRELSIRVIAEGVEQVAELRTLQDLGIHFFQGFLFAKPGFESLPEIRWPADS